MAFAQIGLDFGSSRIIVSKIDENGHFSLMNEGFPVRIGYSDAGRPVFGDDALDLNHHTAFKRELGRNTPFGLGSTQLTARELTALLLKHLAPEIHNFAGDEFELNLTVPAYFSAAARMALQAAAELAGLPVTRVVNEPIAAALAARHRLKITDGYLLVVDWGGSCLDISLVEQTPTQLSVRATSGDSFLGTTEFAELLLTDLQAWGVTPPYEDWLLNLNWADHILQRLGRERSIQFDDLPPYPVERFEEIVRPLLDGAALHVRRALRDAGLGLHQVRHLLGAGGAFRAPLLSHWLEDLLPRAQSWNLNPETLVAEGAARHGCLSAGQEFTGLTVADVVPQTIGVRTARRVGWQIKDSFSPVIKRNTPLPFRITRSFTTVRPGQTALRLELRQGESRILENNELLGHLRLENLPTSQILQEIEVTFAYDPASLLEVTARLSGGGEPVTAIFDRASGLADPLDMVHARRRLAQLEEPSL